MVDTNKRSVLAEAMRQFVSGQITNDDLEETVMTGVTDSSYPEFWYKETGSKDSALLPIVEYAWCLYDDTRNHLFETSADWVYVRSEMARIILFLNSDQEYKWEYVSTINPVLRLSLRQIIESIKTFGKHYRDLSRSRKGLLEKMKADGGYQFWPFRTKEDYEIALANPPFLSTN